MQPSRRRLLGAAITLPLATLATRTSLAQAQTDWPNRPIQFVLGYPTGGATDGVARPLEMQLQRELKQPILFDYRPGAGATIGATYVARAKPDGYTLHMTDSGPMTILPNGRQLPYDPLKDFTPIGLVCEGASVIVVHPSVPANNLAELIALAKARPDSLSYGTSGLGGAAHLAGELFQVTTDTVLTHVPYRGGGPAAMDLVGGQIPVAFASTGTALPFVKSGKMRALAVTSSRRVATFPDVPTVAESGYPDYDATVWFGVVGPAGLPEAIVQRSNQALQTALRSPNAMEALRSQGYEPLSGTPQALAERMQADFDKWGSLIRQQKIAFE